MRWLVSILVGLIVVLSSVSAMAQAQNDQPLFTAVKQFLVQDNWKFVPIEGKTALLMKFKGRKGKWTCYAKTREDSQQFIFYSILDENVPVERRPAVAEFITRANYGMIIGNFEMDFDDGEVRFKTSVDVEGGVLSPSMIRNMIYLNVLMTDKYLPGFMEVIAGTKSPRDAVKDIEQIKPEEGGTE